MERRVAWWQVGLIVAALAVVVVAALWFAPIVGPPSGGPAVP